MNLYFDGFVITSDTQWEIKESQEMAGRLSSVTVNTAFEQSLPSNSSCRKLHDGNL